MTTPTGPSDHAESRSCPHCDQTLTQVDAIWICPVHGLGGAFVEYFQRQFPDLGGNGSPHQRAKEQPLRSNLNGRLNGLGVDAGRPSGCRPAGAPHSGHQLQDGLRPLTGQASSHMFFETRHMAVISAPWSSFKALEMRTPCCLHHVSYRVASF